MSTKTYGRVLRRNEKLISLSYHSCFFRGFWRNWVRIPCYVVTFEFLNLTNERLTMSTLRHCLILEIQEMVKKYDFIYQRVDLVKLEK